MSKRINNNKKCMIILEMENGNVSYRNIGKKYGISKSSAHRICKEKDKFFNPQNITCNYKKRGRPRKLNDRDVRKLERSIHGLRNNNVNFNTMDVVKEAGLLSNNLHRRTYSLYMNRLGYKFLNARKKGLLTEKDKKKRMKYARDMLHKLRDEPKFYCDHVAFYLDGVSFVHKCNPHLDALSPKARVWRKPGEGLQITSKGSKDLPGGKRVHMVVAIAYGKGVILSEPYEKMNGKYFASFVRKNMNLMFGNAGPKAYGKRIFVMDNCPSQNSNQAKAEILNIEAEIHTIPPRSPDLNPIENLFHTVKKKLQDEAIELCIERESIEEFQRRIQRVLISIPSNDIDIIIDSMPERLRQINLNKGYRTKF